MLYKYITDLAEIGQKYVKTFPLPSILRQMAEKGVFAREFLGPLALSVANIWEDLFIILTGSLACRSTNRGGGETIFAGIVTGCAVRFFSSHSPPF